ncbi:MAG TPA: LPS export ABC transporter periplasmic protein LptC [Burkholderiales bacterium]|nr:LPS export ABC transporter periplasmic protein LptC [Burkholderiales bacterium]
MRLSTTRVLPLALMFALALVSFWLERAVREEEPRPATRRHDPDYLISNFTTTSYNRDGGVESVLSASQMVHYPDDDSTELVQPRVVQTRPSEPRMTVRADRGALSRDGDDIFLYDNVLLVREADRERPEARITTSFLQVVRDRALVRTDQPVLIVEDRRTLAGRGMEYNTELQQLLLRADVHGTFEPKPAP